MKNTIRELRKSLNLSQDKFGDKIGITGAAVSRIESGDRGLTDTMFKMICREFCVNEEWLRTGEGEMFLIEDNIDNELMAYVTRITKNDDDFIKSFLVTLMKLDQSEWAVIEKVVDDIGKRRNKNGGIASKNKKSDHF